MLRPPAQLRDDALRIWRAGVEAVHPRRLIPEFVERCDDALRLGDELLPLESIGRIAIVGGGKAGGAMAEALEAALGDDFLKQKSTVGWVNIPEGSGAPTSVVQLHVARPRGLNEPTAAAAEGTAEILRIVRGLGPADLCLCLLSGGGSALLPAPIAGLSIADKAAITRNLSAAGATIDQLNLVRRELSDFKGGGLARACRAGRLIALILSDVLGDDLATIASGPTVPGTPAPTAALDVLRRFAIDDSPAGRRAVEALNRRAAATKVDGSDPTASVTNLIIGNNAAAVDAAGIEAERLGYSHAMISAIASEGIAEDVATQLVEMVRKMRGAPGPDCLISGGEPTVQLAPEADRGRGGRNQQLCLAALTEMPDWHGAVLVSGGTDGEDGPTDAAGAWVDESIAAEAQRLNLDATDSLRRNDAYSFFEQAGGLLKTGPTNTNVCDVRVAIVARDAE